MRDCTVVAVRRPTQGRDRRAAGAAPRTPTRPSTAPTRSAPRSAGGRRRRCGGWSWSPDDDHGDGPDRQGPQVPDAPAAPRRRRGIRDGLTAAHRSLGGRLRPNRSCRDALDRSCRAALRPVLPGCARPVLPGCASTGSAGLRSDRSCRAALRPVLPGCASTGSAGLRFDRFCRAALRPVPTGCLGAGAPAAGPGAASGARCPRQPAALLPAAPRLRRPSRADPTRPDVRMRRQRYAASHENDGRHNAVHDNHFQAGRLRQFGPQLRPIGRPADWRPSPRRVDQRQPYRTGDVTRAGRSATVTPPGGPTEASVARRSVGRPGGSVGPPGGSVDRGAYRTPPAGVSRGGTRSPR